MRSEPFISLRGRGFRAFRVAATERPGGANAGRAWRQSGRRLDLGGDPRWWIAIWQYAMRWLNSAGCTAFLRAAHAHFLHAHTTQGNANSLQRRASVENAKHAVRYVHFGEGRSALCEDCDIFEG